MDKLNSSWSNLLQILLGWIRIRIYKAARSGSALRWTAGPVSAKNECGSTVLGTGNIKTSGLVKRTGLDVRISDIGCNCTDLLLFVLGDGGQPHLGLLQHGGHVVIPRFQGLGRINFMNFHHHWRLGCISWEGVQLECT